MNLKDWLFTSKQGQEKEKTAQQQRVFLNILKVKKQYIQ